MPRDKEILLSFGSNLGDRKAAIQNAVSILSGKAGLKNLTISNYYETEPVGPKDQPFFLNIAVRAFCNLKEIELLQAIKDTEKILGRVQRQKWREREIDIDILLFGNLIFNSPDLTIPHPRMHERNFVLAPASEIAPAMIHPLLHASVIELYRSSADKCKVVRYDG